jgi:hypothetical protein
VWLEKPKRRSPPAALPRQQREEFAYRWPNYASVPVDLACGMEKTRAVPNPEQSVGPPQLTRLGADHPAHGVVVQQFFCRENLRAPPKRSLNAWVVTQRHAGRLR